MTDQPNIPQAFIDEIAADDVDASFSVVDGMLAVAPQGAELDDFGGSDAVFVYLGPITRPRSLRLVGSVDDIRAAAAAIVAAADLIEQRILSAQAPTGGF